MSGNEHAAYFEFGCSATTKGIGTQDDGRTSETLPSGLFVVKMGSRGKEAFCRPLCHSK